jgi:checkpoint serine/threonine-protein kinase
MLVDFGRAVDLEGLSTSSPLKVKFIGPATLKDMECISMREHKSWSLDLDTYGLCASAYVLLFGSHMEVCKESATNLWKTTKPLRRYWNRTLWNLLFDTLLNGGNEQSQPKRLNEIRFSFDEYLNEKNRRREVQALLRHQAAMLPKSKSL